MNGFDCTLEISADDSAEVMKRSTAAIDYLSKKGAVPVAEPTPAAPADDKPPLCPVHNVLMKRSQIHGGWFCSKKLPDGTYCKEQVEA